MAKRVRKSAAPAWKTKWPRNGDLKTWFRAMIEKCDAILDHDTAVNAAILPIEHLALEGCTAEALRAVNRFLRRVPRQQVMPTVRMAETGAKICVEANDLAQMEKYLALAAATEPFNIRKCDKGFSVNSVRSFRVDHGLLDPAEAIDDDQRYDARFSRAWRECRLATADDDHEAARAAADEMKAIAKEGKSTWMRRSNLRLVIRCYADLNDAEGVKKCLSDLDKKDRLEILDETMLARLGMTAEAIARARHDIDSARKELREMTDPNIHFPVMRIGRLLEFLIEQGEKAEARRALQRTLQDMPKWPTVRQGWITSGVYHSLAESMALIDGPAAAEKLLKQATTDAKGEKRSDFRQGAVDEALDLKASLGQLDEAIADARKLRSPTQRRKTLGILLAKARRWKELREVLSEVASPEEAADVAWWIKFELPDGEVH